MLSIALSGLIAASAASAAPPAYIVNGSRTSDPAQVVAIAYETEEKSGYFCSGTLIDAQWVVTAAHCVALFDGDLRGARFSVLFTDDVFGGEWDEEVGVDRWVSHPDYAALDESEPVLTHADIGLLHLERPADAEPLPISADSVVNWGDRELRYVGFGKTADDAEIDGFKRYADIAYDGFYDDLIFAHDDDQNTCYGDSGGAALIPDGADGWKLAGVNSYIFGDATFCVDGANAATRVDRYVPWLDEWGVDSRTSSAPVVTAAAAGTGSMLPLEPSLTGEALAEPWGAPGAEPPAGCNTGGASFGGWALVALAVRRRRKLLPLLFAAGCGGGPVDAPGDSPDGGGPDPECTPTASIEDCGTPADDDCDGSTDTDGAIGCLPWYTDADGDGYGSEGSRRCTCNVPEDAVEAAGDCDDAAVEVAPGRAEVCNGRDDDCNGTIDDAVSEGKPYFLDADGDGFGSGTAAGVACTPPLGASSRSDDCDDANPDRHPFRDEACDGLDNDCDGATLDVGFSSLYADDSWSQWIVSSSRLEHLVVKLRVRGGGAIRVCDGVHQVAVDVSLDEARPTPVVIASLHGAEFTTLQGRFRLGYGDDIVLRGLRFSGADTGVIVHDSASLVADDLVFDATQRDDPAPTPAALDLWSIDTVHLTRAVWTDNVGGPALRASSVGALSAEQSVLAGNASQDSATLVFLSVPTVRLADVTLSDNLTASREEPAAISAAAIDDFALERASIVGNEGAGGGIGLRSVTRATLTDVRFEDNRGSSLGGGLFLADSDVTVTRGTWLGNSAILGAAASLVRASLQLDDATVHANVASSALSGAIHGDRSTLTSITASDWGSGDTANAPQDLRWEGGGYDFSGSVAVNCATTCE
jgi:hypothetical protein